MTARMPDAEAPDLSRYDDWLAWLRKRGEDDPDVLVVWVGGSAATGGYDEWSDLDVELLCTPGTHDATYDRLLARIREEFDVDHVWEVPKEVWPDGRQCFVNLQHRPGLLEEPTRLVDLHLSSLSETHTRVDVRRHGTPIVLHDPDGLVELRPDEDEQMRDAIAAAVEQIRQRRGTGEWLVNRSLARGHDAEAVDLYLRFALGPLATMLRVEHCPWRHDFGLRYLRADLPADVADRVATLVPGSAAADGADLRAQSTACFAWMDELLGD
jgi:predicted nucleotidyltransferase